MRLIRQVGAWIDLRLQLGTSIRETAEHKVPRQTASWLYVFGSAALTCFMLQLVTGILLALIYVPSAGQAWSSLQTLNHGVALGWFIRALHGWGSNFMVAVVLIHMVQVFLFGAYKFPRELTWIVGVFLLLVTLGMAFTGQVLRFDQDAYWGLGIGASIASRVPVIGSWAVNLMLGGPIIAGTTLSRFFALHVFVVPGLLIAFVGLHLLMVLKLGINEWPMPGRMVRRATYLQEYHQLTQKAGVPFVPDAVWKDIFFSGFILLAIAVCAIHFGPFGPSGQHTSIAQGAQHTVPVHLSAPVTLGAIGLTETQARHVYIPSLPAGHYTFELQANATRGEWSGTSARLPFVVRPAWWRTWWFELIALAAFAQTIELKVDGADGESDRRCQ